MNLNLTVFVGFYLNNMVKSNLSAYLLKGVPPGWNYNPSAWSQRYPIIAIAVIATLISGYLSLFQFELIKDVWEPFFGDGSRKILTSSVSNILPIPDAALGALAYIADIVAAVIGGKKRWKTMPWIVITFGFFIGPLGFVSILLVILQPVMFDAWCTLCLASAVCSVAMIGPAMDEVLACLQYLRRVKDLGFSLWKAFWGNKEIYKQVF
jgi:uncharacterized membrane protein